MVDIPPPILIAGHNRSGTSLVAGYLTNLGIWNKNYDNPGHVDNPKGMFENAQIRMIEKRWHLMLAGPQPNELLLENFPTVRQLQLKAIKNRISFMRDISEVLENQNYKSNMPWLYKGSRVSYLWPIWAKAFPGAKFIICRRDRDSIIKSCRDAVFMRSYRLSQHELILRIEAFDEYLDALMKSGNETYEFWPEEIIKGANLEPLQNLCKQLGIEFKVLAGFVNLDMWHHKSKG